MKTLVIGYAANVLDDMAKVNLDEFDHVIAVNKAITLYPSADVWISLHPEKMHMWSQIRVGSKVVSFNKYVNNVGDQIKYEIDEEFPYLFKGQSNSGSSGLYAVKYALEVLRSDEVVLAGVPMDPELSHHDDTDAWKEQWGVEDFWQTWVSMADFLRKKNVWSLSGRTAELLNR